MNQKVKVFKKDIQSEVPLVWIAEHVEKISTVMQSLQQTRVTDKLIIALVHDQTKIGKTEIEAVLKSLSNLDKTYLKPKKENN